VGAAGDGSARGVAWAVAGRAVPARRDRVRAEHPGFGTGPERGDRVALPGRPGREYDEFAERCAALLDEIGKEDKAGKYTFAELEESEQDLEKLARWLGKIQARDFFPDERGQEAAAMLARCQTAVEAFSQSVYAAEEVTGSGARGLQAPGGADTGQADTAQADTGQADPGARPGVRGRS
jgi:hypothetical protein